MDKDLRDHVAWLNAKITLDEEANDPDGLLAGLYWARKEAVEASRRPPEPPVGVNLTVWNTADPVARLNGFYEGREGLAEGLSAVLMTVLDL